MLEYEIKDKKQRPWNYEVEVNVKDTKDIIHRITVVFPKEPSESFLKREVERRVLLLEEQLNTPEPEIEKTYTVNEINIILRNAGLLTENEDFEKLVGGIVK